MRSFLPTSSLIWKIGKLDNWKIGNKLAKLRKCASRLHFERYSLEKYSLVSFVVGGDLLGDAGDLLGDGGDLLGDGGKKV